MWDWWYTENPTPNPFADISDSDGDGLTDAEELTGSRNPYGEPTNPHNADSDGDGLSDYAECITHGTNPNTWATDDDIYPWPPPSGAVSDWWGSDSYEIANGWDPLNPDENTNGIPDSWEMAFPGTNLYGHADDDGISNYDELMQNSDPHDPDSHTAQPYVIRYESSMPGWVNDGMTDIGLEGWVKTYFEGLKTDMDLCVWVKEGRTQEQFRVEWRDATPKGIHWLSDQEVVTGASATTNTRPYLFVQDLGLHPDFTGKLGGEYKITVFNVDLDIDVDDDGDVDDTDEQKEESPGAIIFENWDNDDNDTSFQPDKEKSSVTGENDLVPIYPKLEPMLNIGTLKLEAATGGSRIKVWSSATKGTEITLPKTWELATETIPDTLYLEGYDESASANDIELKLSYLNGGSTICADKIKLTIIRLNLATVVHRELAMTDNEWLTWLPALGCSIIYYDHAGIVTAYNGQRTRQDLTNDVNWEVMEMQSGIGIHAITLADFKRPSPSSSLAYFGASRNPNSYENDSTRNALLHTANYMISFVAPAYPSFWPAGIPKAIEYSSGNAFISDPVSVWALRCDALPEFIYEWVGVPLWSNTHTGHTSIRYYPEDHNDRPDCSIDADREMSPRAQWGGFGNENTTLQLIQNYQPELPQ